MEKLYEGKSKIVYAGEAPGTCIIRYKDTATAGNGAKKEDLPGKGKLNAEISNYIYQYLMDNGVKTHLLKVIDDTTVLVKQAEIVMVEVIVRNVAAGSFSKKYGVPEGTALKNTVVEFSLKSDELGDPMINDCQITALGVATRRTPSVTAEMRWRRWRRSCRSFWRKINLSVIASQCHLPYRGEALAFREASPLRQRLPY